MNTEYFVTQQEPQAKQRRCMLWNRRQRILALLISLALLLVGFVPGYYVGRSHAIGSDVHRNNANTPSIMQKSNIPDHIILPDYVKEDLLPVNEYSRCGDKLTQVNAVVIHYVGNPNTTAWQNRSYFENLATTGDTSASSNLIVGMEGETLLCVPLDEVAYCSNERNRDSISIEFCHPKTDGKPTQATYDTLVKLTAWLCELYGLDAQYDVIRHYDVIGKQCPMYFVQNEDEWTQFKSDVAQAMS